jgi:hypothetical protein
MAGSTARFNNDRYYCEVGGYQVDDEDNNTNYIPLLSMVENVLIKKNTAHFEFSTNKNGV